MGKIFIIKPLKNAKRIKVIIPYEYKEVRAQFKALNTSFWHPNQKLWSIANTTDNFNIMKLLFKGLYEIKESVSKVSLPKIQLNEQSHDVLLALEKTLVLKHYSPSTIQAYRRMLILFLGKFQHQDIKLLSKDQIESFVYELISKNRISETFQNQLINAIKAYYEHVLGMPRAFYDIKRPKRSQTLPSVLSKEEIIKILQDPKNLKHRAILWTIYSAGLRISELVNLRIDDIRSKEGYIFIKGSKGKKDRKTILSEHLVTLLRQYYKTYRPSYWLFEGQTGGKYSVTSVRKIFRKAVKNTGSNKRDYGKRKIY